MLARRIKIRWVLPVLFLFCLCANVAADIVYVGAQSQSFYVRINRTGDTAFDLTEGTALKAGQYTATNATIAATGLPALVSSYRVLIGTAATQTSTDIDVGVGVMIWNGTATVDLASNQPISPQYVNRGRTWRFDSPSQMTATPIITELKPFNGLCRMNWSAPLPDETSVFEVESATITPTAGVEPVLGTPMLSPDKLKVDLPIDASIADPNTYTIEIGIESTDGQHLKRKGTLIIQ